MIRALMLIVDPSGTWEKIESGPKNIARTFFLFLLPLMLLSGIAGLGWYTLRSATARASADAAVLHVYLRDDAKQADVDTLRQNLAGNPRVVRVNTGFEDGYRMPALGQKRSRPRPQFFASTPGM